MVSWFESRSRSGTHEKSLPRSRHMLSQVTETHKKIMGKKEEKVKFVDCSNCESRIGAEVLASCNLSDKDSGVELIVYLLKCPVCALPICAVSEVELVASEERDGNIVGEWEEGLLERVWPYPKKDFFGLPTLVKQSLEEAEKCFDAKANLACSVMCRRTLETLCVDLGLLKRSLPENLQELKTKGIIDGRLAEWGEALRWMGNIGAHASKGHINKQDARDILDFTVAICDYVYILTDKYEKFKVRQQKKIVQFSPPKVNPTERSQQTNFEIINPS